MRYLVFAYEHHDRRGGWADFVAAFGSKEAAIRRAETEHEMLRHVDGRQMGDVHVVDLAASSPDRVVWVNGWPVTEAASA